MPKSTITVRNAILILLSAIAIGSRLLAQSAGNEALNFLPIVVGNYPGSGQSTETPTPASNTPTPTGTGTATATSTTTSTPTASAKATDGPSPTPTPTLGGNSPSYVEVGALAGLTAVHDSATACGGTHYGSGSAWADVDNDGDPDLFTTNHGGSNHFYRNDGDGNSDDVPEFTDIVVSLGLTDTLKSSIGAVFIDYDNDGDQDLYVTHAGGNTLYQNQFIGSGTLSFTDVTAFAGVAGSGGRSMMSAWADFDQDGLLDLMVTRHQCTPESSADQLFHNDGGGQFSDVSGYLCPGGTAPCTDLEGLGFSPGWFDYDNDGDQDLYIANDKIREVDQPNKLWRNDGSDGDGGWTFTNVSSSSNSDLAINSMGLGIGDYDNDGNLDLAISDIGPAELLRNTGNHTFTLESDSSNVSIYTGSTTWGTVFFDFNNDVWLDLYLMDGPITLPGLAVAAPGNQFLKNEGNSTFSNYQLNSGLNDTGAGRNASTVDFNGDGYVDVLLNNLNTELRLYKNQETGRGNTNHWLAVTVQGTTSNRDGIGSRLTLVSGSISQIREITTGPTHGGGDYRAAFFGMGTAVTGTLSIRWPHGVSRPSVR